MISWLAVKVIKRKYYIKAKWPFLVIWTFDLWSFLWKEKKVIWKWEILMSNWAIATLFSCVWRREWHCRINNRQDLTAVAFVVWQCDQELQTLVKLFALLFGIERNESQTLYTREESECSTWFRTTHGRRNNILTIYFLHHSPLTNQVTVYL